MQKLLWTLFFLYTGFTFAQVKVGDNINTIDASSILELESEDKVFVLTRMSTSQMNAVNPLNGALVYNTDENCLFVYDGAVWKTLCNTEVTITSSATPPEMPISGDFWLNESDQTTNIWNGNNWTSLPKSTWNGSGPPSMALVPSPLAGNIYVDNDTGDLYTYDGTTWLGQTIVANNGLTKVLNTTVELGGILDRPTEITTDNTNTLALSGLEEEIDNTNAIVTVDDTSGVLRKTPISALVQQEEIVIIANDNQNQFTPPLSITDSKKLNVYRNGVKLGFTVIDATTIELETPVVCYQNDEIRIVQFY